MTCKNFEILASKVGTIIYCIVMYINTVGRGRGFAFICWRTLSGGVIMPGKQHRRFTASMQFRICTILALLSTEITYTEKQHLLKLLSSGTPFPSFQIECAMLYPKEIPIHQPGMVFPSLRAFENGWLSRSRLPSHDWTSPGLSAITVGSQGTKYFSIEEVQGSLYPKQIAYPRPSTTKRALHESTYALGYEHM